MLSKFPAIKKTEFNPILRSKLLELDLNCPIYENNSGSESPTLGLRMTDRTAIVFQLDKNADPVALQARIKAIVDTAHFSPNRAKIIADALVSFLQVRGIDKNFRTILATTALSLDTEFVFDCKQEKRPLPSMPIRTESAADLAVKQLPVANMPSLEKSRTDSLDQKTINLGGPKNLNFRRKRSWGFF